MKTCPIQKGSLMFAPMEGITDSAYRDVIHRNYPHWDTYSTDFLRVSSVGLYPDKHVIKHFGKKIYQSDEQRKKTAYQILTSLNAKNIEIAKQIEALGFEWLDINLGCPSSTVIKRKGGSFLLSEQENLKEVVSTIRDNYNGFLSTKIRVGFKNDELFESNIKLLESIGVDAIIIHARTREQLYKGKANWQYIKKATELTKLPIIGNGDIWNEEDIDLIQNQTSCHSVMIARGAMQSPWLAKWKKQTDQKNRKNEIIRYFNELKEAYLLDGYSEYKVHKRFKGLSRYIFDPLENGADLKIQILRGQNLQHFFKTINSL